MRPNLNLIIINRCESCFGGRAYWSRYNPVLKATRGLRSSIATGVVNVRHCPRFLGCPPFPILPFYVRTT